MNRNTMTARQVLENAEAHLGVSLRVYTSPDNEAALLSALRMEAVHYGHDALGRIEVVVYRTPEERMRAAQAYEPKRAEG